MPMRKPAIYEIFRAWYLIPDALKGIPMEMIDRAGGTRFDPELLAIKNTQEFCDKYKINRGTAWQWAKKVEAEPDSIALVKRWSTTYLSNIMHAFYLRTLKEADAPRVKLWLQFIHEWVEPKDPDQTTNERPVVVILDGEEYLRNLPPPPGVELK